MKIFLKDFVIFYINGQVDRTTYPTPPFLLLKAYVMTLDNFPFKEKYITNNWKILINL